MERRKPEMDQQKWKTIQNYAENGKGLVGALAGFTCHPYGGNWHTELWRALSKLYSKPFAQLSAKEFLCRDLENAFTTLAGKEMAEKVPHILAMRLEGQFSSSPWRRSYRSKYFAFYVDAAVELLCELIRQSCYPDTVMERLCSAEVIHGGFEYLLAFEIRQGNKEVIASLHEAMMGDNTQIVLTREIIDAIVISGHEPLLDDLIKLLLAAKLQEGLRQQILEAADKGTSKVLSRILKVCIDNSLFRFSGAIRAFDAWTGMGYGDNKPAHVQKYAQLAYECLTDEAKRKEYYKSDNNVEAYFALWALGCQEFYSTHDEVSELLDDPKHYRRVLGWMFVSRTDNNRYQMILASSYLEERDEELLAWITGNLAQTWALHRTNWRVARNSGRQAVPNPNLPEDKEERKQLFYQLKELGAYIGSKKRTFSGNPFDFISVTLESERVHGCMIGLAGYDMDDILVDELLELSSQMSVDQRQSIICAFLQPDTNAKHRAYLQNCLNDRSIMVKELAVERLEDCKLTTSDMNALADSLRSKSSDLRAGIMSVFKKQHVELLRPLIPLMLSSTEENQNQAAIELLIELKEKNPDILAANRSVLDGLYSKKISTQTQILLDQLLANEKEETAYAPDNGYGLYDPNAIDNYLKTLDAPIKKAGFLSRVFGGNGELYSAKQIKALIPEWNDMDRLLERMDQVFVRHANDEIEVEWYDGSRHKVLFGDPGHNMIMPADSGYRSLSDSGAKLEMLPFWSEFYEALGEYSRDIPKMLGLFYLITREADYTPPFAQVTYSPWYLPIAALDLAPQLFGKCRQKYNRAWQMLDILGRLPMLFHSHDVFVEIMKMYRSMIAIWGEDNLGKTYLQIKEDPRYIVYGTRPQAIGMNHKMLTTWRKAIHMIELNERDFATWFGLEYRLEHNIDSSIADSLNTGEFFRAYQANMIPRDVLVAFLMDVNTCMPGKIKMLTNSNRWTEGRNLYEKYPFTKPLMSTILDRVVAVEEKRGELRTPLTGHSLAIERFEGAEHFCNLLAALGKENFFRGYEFSMNDTKKAVLSRLLKRCYPAKEDTPERLAALLKDTDISDKRLAEAVMYAPQWAEYAEKILGWPGLKCGVWFFHAHINETFSAEKETETAIYSPISPQQFNDGAFDKNWFFEAYEQLGEKRFQILYKSAKYITSGSNQHRRSQLYSDAVLGKLNAQELVQEIVEKRNQEKLRCYPLIPIADGDSQEALRRYEFIQKFLKESKQFGAQRRDSEKKACNTAMENLAITTGLMDVNRLMWQMESQKIEQIRPLMEPQILDGVSVWLTIDENGDASITMEKAGKTIKTPPKSFAKNETFQELKATVKELKDLKRRSKESMERAMMECTGFELGELRNICNNPILAPMLFRLVWTDGVNNGFLQQSADGLALLKLDGESITADTLHIAHPHHLKIAGDWAGFMQLLYEKKVVQPFKQVFREYYPIIEDERQERTISRRYAGHQVQPQRTVALLKSRGWTVDYEEGLQKVCYKENLIVKMYAMADWFSPADIEAPTLETVEFLDRSTKENVPLENVPPILFSETMRDLDLVVSVAHVGGVDPEASHSTVEMRVAIAGELAKLLKLSNVSWIGSHAKIQGKLANYSVHMGSGVVHAEGIGMVSILPVHSQARGRVFLPFADDDPKTAEIMSKILLLSEDNKIKDPTILSQISR